MKMRILIAFCASAVLATSAQADLIAYWDQNSNSLPGGGFGFTAASFPQAADQGAGSLTVDLLDTTADGAGVFAQLASFAGTTENAQPGIISGGSIAPRGDTNNGMSILWTVDTTLYEDIIVSWAQRGTGTGYDSRAFSYSTDGVTFTPVGTDTGSLSSSWETEVYDLSSISDVEGASSVTFAVTFDGATSGSGNNRLDNITVEGTLIPEPGSVMLVLMGLAAAGAVSMRSRLG